MTYGLFGVVNPWASRKLIRLARRMLTIERFCPLFEITPKSQQRLIVQLYADQPPSRPLPGTFDDSSFRDSAESWSAAGLSESKKGRNNAKV